MKKFFNRISFAQAAALGLATGILIVLALALSTSFCPAYDLGSLKVDAARERNRFESQWEIYNVTTPPPKGRGF